MNAKQVQKFVVSYLDSTGCHLIEKSPSHVVVKLSPDADRALTNRPYYWSFIDRTGTEPETLTYSWSFDPPSAAQGAVSPLSNYMTTTGGRVLREDVYFGSRRLQQLFEAARLGGRCVMLFEEPPRGHNDPLGSHPYTAWLGVNFKVGYQCDMKREELYGWGISLATGIIDEKFMDRLKDRRLTPRLPSNVYLLRNGLSLRKAMSQLELAMERRLRGADFTWAAEADHRRYDELERIREYYEPMLERCEDSEQKKVLEERYSHRKTEIDWQYRPRVTLSVMNCGLFHLPGFH